MWWHWKPRVLARVELQASRGGLESPVRDDEDDQKEKAAYHGARSQRLELPCWCGEASNENVLASAAAACDANAVKAAVQ